MSIEKQVQKSKKIIAKAFRKFGPENIAIEWTGGKDSTLMLWLYKTVSRETGCVVPKCIFVNSGDVFDEINEFVIHVKDLWDLDFHRIENADVVSKADCVGDTIETDCLNEDNRLELASIGFNEDEFTFDPESQEGSHLLKTVPVKHFIEEHDVAALSTAVRMDEYKTSRKLKHFSTISTPNGSRAGIHPVLHFSEHDVWAAIRQFDIPFCTLYEKGYRSLGSRYCTCKTTDIPAWQQDHQNTPERTTGLSDEEMLKERLKSLGYL